MGQCSRFWQLTRRAAAAIAVGLVVAAPGFQQATEAQSLQEIDLDLLRALESNNTSPWLDIPVEVFSLATPAIETGVTLERYLRGRRTEDPAALEAGAFTGVSIVTTQVVVLVAKLMIDRERPPRDHESYRPRLWNTRKTSSFPSGHAALSFAFAGGMGYAYPRWRTWLVVYAVASGLAQLYVGNHYPSDVVAGAMLGYGMSMMVWKHRERLRPMMNKVGLMAVKSTGEWRLAVVVPF